MKSLWPIVIIALATVAVAGEEIADSDMGLSQTSVFDTPAPAPFGYDGSAPAIPPLSPLEVPVIPHKIRDFEKITLERNRCLGCHLLPELIGEELPAGEATPMPASHYAGNVAEDPETPVAGSRWVCTQCHVAQANAELLVRNTSVE